MLVFGVVWLLRPLQKLREDVLDRAQDDMTPISPAQLPAEVRPLVDAVNNHMERYLQLTLDQKQFLDDASHQLRTPLATLRTQIEYAVREPELPRIFEALGAMQRCVDHATRSTNQLLSLARANHAGMMAASMEQFELNALAEEVGRFFLPEALRREHDFGFVPSPEKITVTGVRALLREAITNLVDNAIHHLPEGGHITLAVSAQGQTATVAVADNGPGMSADDRAHVGERFRRGQDAKPGGAGLGLAIVKTIAGLHGGRLVVSDGPGGGVTMQLVLPVQRT